MLVDLALPPKANQLNDSAPLYADLSVLSAMFRPWILSKANSLSLDSGSFVHGRLEGWTGVKPYSNLIGITP